LKWQSTHITRSTWYNSKIGNSTDIIPFWEPVIKGVQTYIGTPEFLKGLSKNYQEISDIKKITPLSLLITRSWMMIEEGGSKNSKKQVAQRN
jgi:hypothetical protein